MSTIRILFFGTPEFAIPSLEALYSLRPMAYSIMAVVTAPDRPQGRGQELKESPVKQRAKARGIAVLQPERAKDPRFLTQLASLTPDIGVIAAYGQIIPKEIIQIPRFGILNVHPSLLPCWRGASPIQYAILHGDTETGVTIMLTDERMDHGPILVQERIRIEGAETAETLATKLAELGGNVLKDTVLKWVAGDIQPQPQDHSKATYTKMLKREDGHIDWKRPPTEIERQIRAFHLWPGSFAIVLETRYRGMRIKLLGAHAVPEIKNDPPGTIFEKNELLHVSCKDGALLLDTVQPEGKEPMSGADFLRGHRNLVGSVLL